MEKVGERYRQFVKEYLPQYQPNELYNDLRNKLVHNYSVGTKYRLTRNRREEHLKQKKDGIIILNLDNFIEDLETALNKYIKELEANSDIRRLALGWYSRYKILVQLEKGHE